ALIDVLAYGPRTTVAVLAQLAHLVLARLIVGADARVDGGSHWASVTAARPAFRIVSAALKIRWQDFSGISFPDPFQCWMYPRDNSTPGRPSAAQTSIAVASASTSRRVRGVRSESVCVCSVVWPRTTCATSCANVLTGCAATGDTAIVR